MGEFLGNGALFEERLSLDLTELELNQFVMFGQASESGKGCNGLLFPAVVCQPTRRERHKHDTEAQDKRREKLKAERNEPCCVFLS